MSDTAAPVAIHATALIVRASGLLLRGCSGAGKSSLALLLLDRAETAGWFGRLVGDDRVLVQAVNKRLLVRPHASIAGQIERRGSGILKLPYRSTAVVRLIVDMGDREGSGDPPPRFPEPDAMRATICGIDLPRVELLRSSDLSGSAIEVIRNLLCHEGLG